MKKQQSPYTTKELEMFRARLTPEQFEEARESIVHEGGVIIETKDDDSLVVHRVYWRSYGY